MIILLVIAGILGLAAWEFLVPYQGNPGGVFVELERGTTTKQLADRLQDEGVIRSRYAFLIWRALHPKTTLQAGEYFFDKPLTPGDVFEKIHRGQIYFEELAIPEGSNMYDISALLKNLHSVKPEDFLKAATDPQTIRDLDPAAPTLEGYLFPSTYRVTRKTTAVELCRLMTGGIPTPVARLDRGAERHGCSQGGDHGIHDRKGDGDSRRAAVDRRRL